MIIKDLPLPPKEWQHWYTMDIPTPAGVFPFEVYAPILKPNFQEPLLVLNEPPSLTTPEPNVFFVFFMVLILILLLRGPRK